MLYSIYCMSLYVTLCHSLLHYIYSNSLVVASFHIPMLDMVFAQQLQRQGEYAPPDSVRPDCVCELHRLLTAVGLGTQLCGVQGRHWHCKL